jgi:hypothetical protein
MKRLLKISIICAISVLALSAHGFTDQYTGGSGDGWGYQDSNIVSPDGAGVSISSAADQYFDLDMVDEQAEDITIIDIDGDAITADYDIRLMIPDILGMQWSGFMFADGSITDSSEASFSITPGTITQASVMPEGLVAGITGDIQVGFTTLTSIPVDGKIVINFPTGFVFDSNGTTTATSTTINGALSVGAEAGVLTITRSDGTIASSGSHSITLTNIKNPTLTGQTGTYLIQTQIAEGNVIDISDDISGVVITPAPIDYFTVQGIENPHTAGDQTTAIVTAYDEFDNIKTDYTGTITFSSSDTKDTRELPENYTFLLDDAGEKTFENLIKLTTASSNAWVRVTGDGKQGQTEEDIVVKHAEPNYLQFKNDIDDSQRVAREFTLPVLQAMDEWGNLCNGLNDAVPYAGEKTISYLLSGENNAPDANADDTWTGLVDFSAGESTTPLLTTLYRAQDTTVTPSDDILAGENIESNNIVVAPETKFKLSYKEPLPSTMAIINAPLDQQPIIAIHDFFGNQTADTDAITLYASTSNEHNITAPGALTADFNPLNAVSGVAEFSGVTYDMPTEEGEGIYIYALASGLTGAFSDEIEFYIAGTTTVDTATEPVADFELIPTKDDIEDAFPVLRFSITDVGEDSIPTLIDKMVVAIAGTGGYASTDIAWAGLYAGGAQIATADGDAITNQSITFGTEPDGDSTADLYSVPNASSVEFTIYIYMKADKLSAVENNTYSFSINEDSVYTDGGLSSRMADPKASVAAVTGTIRVDITHWEVVRKVELVGEEESSIELIAGTPAIVKIRATDGNRNIDTNISGSQTFQFSGLSSIGVYTPRTGVPPLTTNFGNNTFFTFTEGESPEITLTAYKREAEKNIIVTSQNPDYFEFPAIPLYTNVGAAIAKTISKTSGDTQRGGVNATLTMPLEATFFDQYGNPAQYQDPIEISITSYPQGATGQTLTPPDPAIADEDGKFASTFKLGNLPGDYQATIASIEGITGFPIVFSAEALEPVALNITSGNNQSDKRVTEELTEFVVRYVAVDNIPIPGETIGFEIISTPEEAQGQVLSKLEDDTDVDGYARTTLTLGNKRGEYSVRAYIGDFEQVFTATALPGLPYEVLLTGPGSTKAGDISEVYTLSVMDEYDNLSEVSVDTLFDLSSLPSATGTFYSDSQGNTEIIQAVIADDTSSVDFYYMDTLVGSPTIKATYASGQPGLEAQAPQKAISIIPGDMYRFKITGSTSDMFTGDERDITITAYDQQGNIKTDFSGNMMLEFSGANASPSPSSKKPTVLDRHGEDIDFGQDAELSFSSGVATSTIKVYKAEDISISAVSGDVGTSEADSLGILVKHNVPDHMKFESNIPSPQAAGPRTDDQGNPVPFSFETELLAVDLYDNICDGANNNSANAYNPATSRTIIWSLTDGGEANGPEGDVDFFTNPVAFSNGRSTTSLGAILYRAQETSITASITGLPGTDSERDRPSNIITVTPAAAYRVKFTQEPSLECITTQYLETQPVAAIVDTYGNPTGSGYITLAASLTGDAFTPAVNGTLTATSLNVLTVNGVATFSDLTYDYPETIYLRASTESLDPAYSMPIAFSTANEAVVINGPLVEPDEISSLAVTEDDRVDILDFRITDEGNDGFATKIKQITVERDPEIDTTEGWSDYIDSVYITDGNIRILGVVENDRVLFGSGASVIYTIANSTSKTFTLSLFLKAPLPDGADGQKFGFKINAEDNITLDAIGSQFAPATDIISEPDIDIDATNFIITGNTTMNAGDENEITIRAIDIHANRDKDYEGDQTLVFSGASASPNDTSPTCTNYVPQDIKFGSGTAISFSEGQGTSSMKLYMVEDAIVKATSGAGEGLMTTTDDHDLTVRVSGGAPDQLAWETEPLILTVANAFWREFQVSVTDAYGNIASSDVDITLVPTGGSLGADAIETATAQSGLATFYYFSVTCPSYPGYVTLVAQADGVKPTPSSVEVRVEERYQVTVNIRDFTTGTHITDVNLDALSQGEPISGFPVIGNSPFSFSLYAGQYTLSYSKEQYLESGQEVTAGVTADGADGVYDNKITWNMIITSLAEATADYRVLSSFVYDETSDKLSVRLWLERRGILILSDEVNRLGTASVQIFNDTTGTWFSTIDLSAPETDDAGLYYIEMQDVTDQETGLGLVQGRTYFARCIIRYGGLSGTGRQYEGANTFTITVSESMKQVIDKIDIMSEEIKTEVAGVKDVVRDESDQTKTLIETKTEETKTAVEEGTAAVGSRVTQAESVISSRVGAAEDLLTDRAILEGASHILNQDTHVKEGGSLIIRYKTDPGLSPTIDVYDSENTLRISNETMEETIPGESGIYEYSVEFKWGRGSHSVVCKESSRGTLAGINIQVISTDLEDIGSAATMTMSQVTRLSELDPDELSGIGVGLSAATEIINTISLAVEDLSKLGGAIDELTNAANVDNIREQINLVAEKMREFSVEQGLKIEEMFEISDEQFQNIDYIRNKTQEIKSLIELQKEILERRNDEPVVKSWLEIGE